jgi:hypothetical protein
MAAAAYRGGVPDEVLEVGRERTPRFAPPRWSVAAVTVALVAGAGVFAVSRGRPVGGGEPLAGPTGGPAVVRPAQPDLLREPKNIRILTFGPTASAYDVDSGRATPLRLPSGVRSADVTDAVALSTAAVVVAGGRAWTVPYDGRRTRALGRVDRVVAMAGRDAVWLLRRGTAVPVDAAGRRIGGRFEIALDRHVLASTRGELVLGSATPGGVGRIEHGDPVPGARRSRISDAGVVHSAGPRAVAWSPCAGPRCEVLVTDVETGFAERLPRLPTGLERSGPALLSPDGRHFAVLARRPGSTTDVLVVGHLPGTGREDRAEVVARDLRGDAGGSLVRFVFAANGWLLVATADGRTLLVGPGPHGQLRLPTLLPPFRLLTAY